MSNTISGAGAAASGTSAPSTLTSATDKLASEDTFLKLLVTQLKNQDPTNPQDSTQFVAQLAQFSGLEQQLQMRQDLDAIKQSLAAGSSTPTGSSQATSPTTA